MVHLTNRYIVELDTVFRNNIRFMNKILNLQKISVENIVLLF